MKRSRRRGAFTLVELLVVIAIIGVLVSLLLPAVQKVREAANRMSCTNNLKQIGLGLHNYVDTNKHFPPGYIDGNTNPNSTPDQDVGPGWGWAALILPFMEQGNLNTQINYNVGIGVGVNVAVSQVSIKIYQCPSDGYQDPFPVYDSTFSTPIATVAHANYAGCNGWIECFNGAGGNPQPGPWADGNVGTFGGAGCGFFYRNSKTKIADVLDGLSQTICVGERCALHSPLTWTGAVTGGRVPAWMADQPPVPYVPPPDPAYDYADFDEALCLSHGNANHLPDADFPVFDPDTFWSLHPGGANYLFGDGSVHFLSKTIDGYTYQHMTTVAGGEILSDIDW